MAKNMLELIAATIWTCFVIYITWYFTKAKHEAPITSHDARILWKIHKQNISCGARRWREVRHRGKVVGFECECGYKHIQKRPLVAGLPAPHTGAQIELTGKIGILRRSAEVQRE